jgi:hypothetical protein
MEEDPYTDDTEVACVLADDEFEGDEESPAIAAAKSPDESLSLRRRRVERLMDAKRLSKQLFDFAEMDAVGGSYYDDDLFDENGEFIENHA